MEYLEELDKIHQKLTTLNLATFESNEVNRLIGRAFRAGLAEQADPLEGYSNLTAAISAGEPIDWERLDGLKVQCVNPEVGTLRGKLERVSLYYPFSATAWWKDESDRAYIEAFNQAWRGQDGWSLWVEGEIPLRRKTADQLEVGHFFTGRLSCTVRENLMCVAEEHGRGKHVRFAADFTPSRYPASEWVVLEEHGPFRKPEGM